MLLIICIAAVVMTGCKATQYQFDSRMPLREDSKKKIAEALGIPNKNIEQVDIYQAVLCEELVNENGVAEYTLRNSLSKKPKVDLGIARYFHEIYLYVFTVRLTRTTARYGLWLTTASHNSLSYIRIGPAYLGTFGSKNGREYLLMEKELFIRHSGNQVSLGRIKDEVSLRFYLEDDIDEPRHYRVSGIINEKPNKISGLNKYLIYDIPVIFNDPDALTFTFIESIRP